MQPSPRLDTVRPCPSVRVFMTTEPPAPAPRSQGGIPSPTTGPPAGRYTCLPARPASGDEDLHCTVELADLDLRDSRRRRLQLVPHQLSVEGEGGVVTGHVNSRGCSASVSRHPWWVQTPETARS